MAARHKGRITTFKKDRGFGFLEDSEGTSRFFHIHDYEGLVSPREELEVMFTAEEGDKGPRARDVRVKNTGPPQKNDQQPKQEQTPIRPRNPNKDVCPDCHREVTPKLILDEDKEPNRTLCPFCGGVVSQLGPGYLGRLFQKGVLTLILLALAPVVGAVIGGIIGVAKALLN